MRGDFVINFLETLKDIAIDIGVGWSRISYKGVRYSDFNIYGYENRKKYVGFKNLARRGFIRNIDDDCFVFTKSGQKWLSNSFIRYFRTKSGGKWDKKWRVVIFDIPQELHKERVKFRKKLKYLGFIMLQKSVFIFPYPCSEEVGDICKDLGVGDYIDILIAESPGFRETELLKTFKLQ